MNIYKDKQFLIFDFENGKSVKYDFALKKTIGIRGNFVKDLRTQLRGLRIYDILDCCEDKKYANFLRFVQRMEEERYGYYIENIGTILDRVPKYSNYEQIFSAGIEDIICNDFKYTIKDIPKSLIKICKNHKITLSNSFLNYYKENPDAYYLAYNLEYISLNDKDIYNILYESTYYYTENVAILACYFNRLINEFKYNAKNLLKYLDELKTFEAISDMGYLIRELYDYANMMNQISGKFDRYPRHFLTTHKIACRNYQRMKKEFPEEMFRKHIDKSLEFEYKGYKFIYPESTQDIKDEAVCQNNCVSSYIDKVLNGECHILFLRKVNNLDKSLVTIEVRNNKIVQARRKFNDPVTEEEQEIIDKWNKIKFEKEKELCV
ncbi:PcfJ domain-containing protein [Clostridium sp.]|uniref:PcfJ domain-containing protein n=1 Tax=Clostridium sp. TaxID=1506 RepID=UPI0032169BAB